MSYSQRRPTRHSSEPGAATMPTHISFPGYIAPLEAQQQTTDRAELSLPAPALPQSAFLKPTASLASAGVPFTNGFTGL